MEKQDEKKGFFSKISDGVKVSFCRWWFAGAIYFFIAWGTGIGMSKDPLDLVFILGLVCGAVNIFIFHPIMYSVFDIERKGKIINKKYYERTVIEGVFLKLAEILKCILVVILVFCAYQWLNMAINAISGNSENTIPVPGEPILFATFFLIFYNLFTWIVNIIRSFIEKRKGVKNNA